MSAPLPGSLPRLYQDLSEWYRLLTPPEDYVEEAAALREMLTAVCRRRPRTLLELGCGAGHNAVHLAGAFELTLSDLSPQMLALSQALNPQCEHVLGDMRTLRLERRFDCVLIHDAVSYMLNLGDLQAAIRTAARHCAPGGVVLLMPDVVRDTFSPGCDMGGSDGDDGRGLRFLEWRWDPDPADTWIRVEMSLMTRDGSGEVRYFQDPHLMGLFSAVTWWELLRAEGLRLAPVRLPPGAPNFGTARFFRAVQPEDT